MKYPEYPNKPLNISEADRIKVANYISIQFALSQEKTREAFYKICLSVYNKIKDDNNK